MASPFPSLRVPTPGSTPPGEVEEAPRRFQVSHSQLEAYRLCPRKWWLRWVAQVKEPRRTSLILGDRLHALAESILRRQEVALDWAQGLDPQEQAWCQRAALFAQQRGLWAPDPLAWVEYPFVLLIGEHHRQQDGLPQAGTAVVEDPRAGQSVRRILPPPEGGQDPYLVGFIDQLVMGHEYAAVIDHKSAKNRRWGKKQRDVVGGDQLPTYACIPMQRHPHLTWIDGAYNVFLKEADPSEDVGYQVRDRIHREVVVEKWSGIIRDTTHMQTLRQQVPKVGKDVTRAQNWKSVPGAVDLFRGQTQELKARCNGFGGCFAKDACFGYCSMEKVIQRLDAPPSPAPAPSSASSSNVTPNPFGSLRDQAPLRSLKGPSMPFGIKPTPTPQLLVPAVGAHCYVADPDTGVQYRATILAITGTPAQHQVLLWPEVGQEPDPAQSAGYVCPVQLPADQILMVPKEGVPLQGYAEALRLIGQQAPPWQPRISEQILGRTQRVEATPFAAAVTAAKPVGPPQWHHLIKAIGSVVRVSLSTVDATYERELTAVRDEGLKLRGIMAPIAWNVIKDVQVIGTVGELAAQAAAAKAVPEVVEEIVPVMVVTPQAVLVPVPAAPLATTSGSPLPQEAPPFVQEKPPAANPEPVVISPAASSVIMHPSEASPAVPEGHVRQFALTLVGKLAHVQIAGEPVSHRLKILGAPAEGLYLDGRADPVPWDQIAELKAADEVARPGDKADAKRLEKAAEEKELLASGPAALAQKVLDAVKAALALDQPRMGKKELLKLQVVVEALRTSLVGGGGVGQLGSATPTLIATGIEGVPTPGADDLTKASMEGNRLGWAQALDEAIKALQALR